MAPYREPDETPGHHPSDQIHLDGRWRDAAQLTLTDPDAGWQGATRLVHEDGHVLAVDPDNAGGVRGAAALSVRCPPSFAMMLMEALSGRAEAPRRMPDRARALGIADAVIAQAMASCDAQARALDALDGRRRHGPG